MDRTPETTASPARPTPTDDGLGRDFRAAAQGASTERRTRTRRSHGVTHASGGAAPPTTADRGNWLLAV